MPIWDKCITAQELCWNIMALSRINELRLIAVIPDVISVTWISLGHYFFCDVKVRSLCVWLPTF